jgi:hypothetical protein
MKKLIKFFNKLGASKSFLLGLLITLDILSIYNLVFRNDYFTESQSTILVILSVCLTTAIIWIISFNSEEIDNNHQLNTT